MSPDPSVCVDLAGVIFTGTGGEVFGERAGTGVGAAVATTGSSFGGNGSFAGALTTPAIDVPSLRSNDSKFRVRPLLPPVAPMRWTT